jgi:predicted RNase H-like HicB family nuclease
MSKKYKVSVILMRGERGEYVVSSPVLGIATQASTREEALHQIKEAIEGVLEVGDEDTLHALPHAYSKDVQVGTIEVDVPNKQGVQTHH